MRTVLIVDADAGLRGTFGTALRFEGYRVVEAHDGFAALKCFESDPPDLIVLELDLPWISGQALRGELAARVRLRDIPVVVVTGAPVAAIIPPVACLLHKPVTPDRLVRAVRRCMASGVAPLAS